MMTFVQMRKWVLGTGLSVLLFAAFPAQNPANTQLTDRLIEITLPKHAPEFKQRKWLEFKSRAAYYNPLNYIGAGLLFLYQNLLSDQIQARCSYETSCSQYTKLSIQKKGFIIGTFSGFNQLSECFPAVAGEHCRHAINREGKVINPIDGEEN